MRNGLCPVRLRILSISNISSWLIRVPSSVFGAGAALFGRSRETKGAAPAQALTL